MSSLRWIQNAALLGLIGGDVLLIYGMTGGGLIFALMGALVGALLGVPAALLSFSLQGYRLDWSLLAAMIEQAGQTFSAKTPTLDAPTPPDPLALPRPTIPTTIPTDVASTDKVVIAVQADPPQPPVQRLTHADRQLLIDEIQAETDVAIVMGWANHDDELVRVYAVQRLGMVGGDVAMAALRAALDDPSVLVGRAARLALNRHDPPPDAPPDAPPSPQ